MFIEISNTEQPFAYIGKKLFKKLNFKAGHTAFIQIVQIKGTNRFALIRRIPTDTFKTQCNMVTKTWKRNTPAQFYFTIPSLEYFMAVAGIEIHGRKVLNVKEKSINNLKYFEICEK